VAGNDEGGWAAAAAGWPKKRNLADERSVCHPNPLPVVVAVIVSPF